MNKQELIHLHGLLHEVAAHYRSTGDGTPDLRRYRSLRTRPTSIYHAKSDHQRAVFALAGALAGDMNDEDDSTHSETDESDLEAGAETDRLLERSSP